MLIGGVERNIIAAPIGLNNANLRIREMGVFVKGVGARDLKENLNSPFIILNHFSNFTEITLRQTSYSISSLFAVLVTGKPILVISQFLRGCFEKDVIPNGASPEAAKAISEALRLN